MEVHLLQLPVPVWAAAQQQADELLREFALVAAGSDESHHVPARLTALVETLNSQFAGVSTEQEQRLFAAAAAGEERIDDLAYFVPPEAGPASQTLGDLLDEADEHCRAGQHLLTLAAPDEVVAFRRWYLREFVRQCAGLPPVPWPDYDGSWDAPAWVDGTARGRPGVAPDV